MTRYALALVAALLVALHSPAAVAARDPVQAPPGYEAIAARIPAAHWALVGSIHLDRDNSAQARRADMSIHLPRVRVVPGSLAHEVGHLVLYADPELERAWREAFWPGGRVRGATTSAYARTSPAEDFAETYQEYVEHGGRLEQLERRDWMRDRVFGPAHSGGE